LKFFIFFVEDLNILFFFDKDLLRKRSCKIKEKKFIMKGSQIQYPKEKVTRNWVMSLN
jgi:hypothetical protein